MPLKESGRADPRWIITSITPDVCKSPVYPVPYPIVGYLSASVRTSPTVRFAGSPVFHMKSRVTTVIGDQPGVGGGVVSGVNMGYCRPITHLPTVNVNGSHILNDKMAYFWMNCAGPEGPGNTVGMLTYSGFMGQAAVSPSGETSGGDPSVSAETPGEAGFLGGQGFAEGGCMGPLPGMGDSPLGGGFLDGLMSPEGIVGLAQQAHGLATTDWSNPGAALGAIGGVAGMAGLGSVAQAAGLAQQGLALATTDWSNPGSALGTVMNLAGMSGLGGSLLPNPSGPNPAPSVPINDGCWGTGGGSSSDLPPGIKIDGCF